jgi:hypothetical protein
MCIKSTEEGHSKEIGCDEILWPISAINLPDRNTEHKGSDDKPLAVALD